MKRVRSKTAGEQKRQERSRQSFARDGLDFDELVARLITNPDSAAEIYAELERARAKKGE